MEHLKQQCWYKVMVYSFVIIYVGSFVLFGSIKTLNATKTQMDCPGLSKPDCIMEKQDPSYPKLIVPPCTRKTGE